MTNPNLREKQNQREPSILISHSSKDIVVARAVRNLLEDRNHSYVELIGLASYETKSRKEVWKLLKDEIKARNWLLLVDSDNARESENVQFEIQTAKELGRPFYTIDCNRFIDLGDRYTIEKSLEPCVEAFSKSLRVFISYSNKNRSFAQALSHTLEQRKFQVWRDKLSKSDMNWAGNIAEEIKKTAKTGIMIPIITPDYIASKWALMELEQVLEQGGSIIPVILSPVHLPPELERFQFFDFSGSEVEANQKIQKIIEFLQNFRHRKHQEICGGKILVDPWGH